MVFFQVYKFSLYHTFHTLSHYPNSVSGHGNAPYGGLQENYVFILSLPANKEMVTEAHRPLETSHLPFGQSVKSQKMYAHIF